MERSFKKEVEALKLGDGETFHGEGILAVTKALLQSGVSYVGGYQGAPVSHLLDVLVDAEDIIGELGVHLETCTNEASAAAMLGASINYPLRGAVTWKSIVGTNVAADALSNLASPGVIGGALIIVGEDYGEGASVIQERSYAFAMKSSMWLLDPRPDLPTIVRMVEKGFELSEASHAPVMLELRIRACHVTGAFTAKDNRRAAHSRLDPLAAPARFDYARLAHPPVTFVQEKLKVDERLPAAQAFIRAQASSTSVSPAISTTSASSSRAGSTTALLRALERLGLADVFGTARMPLYVLNVVYPLVPEEVREFCAGKRAVLVVEEGYPDYIEQAINVAAAPRRSPDPRARQGRCCRRPANTPPKCCSPASRPSSPRRARRGVDLAPIAATAARIAALKPSAAAAVGELPARPPTFCTGCPERPVFSALKLVQREIGPTHISADIGCHSFATFAAVQPWATRSSATACRSPAPPASGPTSPGAPIAVMGDGGFWHNGLITGVASNLFNKGDGVLVVMQNGYTSATGQQYMPSSSTTRNGAAPGMDIETTLRAMGVNWLRKVRTYGVANMAEDAEGGDAHRRARPQGDHRRRRMPARAPAPRARRGRGEARRAASAWCAARYGVDDEICTGDHSCIRLSGCPSLTVKPNPDPLRTDPVASVIESCVGCGLCGEVAHAAVLCPSFYRAEVIRNPSRWDRALDRAAPPRHRPAGSARRSPA